MSNEYVGAERAARAGLQCRIWVAVILGCCLPAWATCAAAAEGGVPTYLEYRERIDSAQAIAPLDAGMFGDRVSLYNGSTTFSVVDLEIPGNSQLPVRFARVIPIELQVQGMQFQNDDRLGGIGNWRPDIPFISTTYPVNATPADLCAASTPRSKIGEFLAWEYYQGAEATLAADDRRLLFDRISHTPAPTGGSYYWATSMRDVVDCIPMKAGSAHGGQGFRLTTTDGIRYSFDVAVTRNDATLERPHYNIISEQWFPAYLHRRKIYLLATKVEDRFGNWVQYSYNASGHPTDIWANDGRQIHADYVDGRLSTMSANGQTWTYEYLAGRLSKVIRPDTSSWEYTYAGNGSLTAFPHPGEALPPAPSSMRCAHFPYAPLDEAMTLEVKHPSGARGSFEFINTRHFRSGVAAGECWPGPQNPDDGGWPMWHSLQVPYYFDVMSLRAKTITGHGLPSMRWDYSYPGLQTLWGDYGPWQYPCTTCDTSKIVRVVNPDQTITEHVFGILHMVNDGKPLGKRILDSAQVLRRSEVISYMTDAEVASASFYPLFGMPRNVVDISPAKVNPVVKQVVVQDGASFIWEVSRTCGSGSSLCFDAFARPTHVTKRSEGVQ